MELKNDKKFQEKLSCGLGNDMKNMADFHQSTWSFKIWTLIGSFYPKYKMYKLKICRGAMYHDNEEWCEIWRGVVLSNLTNCDLATEILH